MNTPHLSPSSSRTELPIDANRQDLLAAIRLASAESRPARLILQAPTGSGKSTRVPQFLLESDLLRDDESILILQPRRIAARLLAARVAAEQQTRLGGKIGYQIRFENHTSSETKAIFLTEGLLSRKMLADPDLKQVKVVILDEFHERSLHTDLALARLKRLQETTRPDLIVIVMSATLDTEKLADYLHPCSIIRSEGKTFPVTIEYFGSTWNLPLQQQNRSGKPPRGVWDDIVDALETCYLREKHEGDCLVFLPGAHEIRRTISALEQRSWTRGFAIHSLFSDLPPSKQDAVLQPSSRPKIIVSTNVAETSLTIHGITLVVDSGLARMSRYDSRRGMETLTIEKISQASAEQRAGRAGRLSPGRCLRLWTESEHRQRAPRELPEILRCDLAETVLSLLAAGEKNLTDFPWFEVPLEHAMDRTWRLLEDLGAVDPDRSITPLGKELAKFPTHPRWARLILAGQERDCLPQAILCAAMAQGRGLWARKATVNQALKPQDWSFKGDVSDFQPMIRAWVTALSNQFRPDACAKLGVNGAAAREAFLATEQLFRISRHPSPEDWSILNDLEAQGRLWECLLLTWPDHVAALRSAGLKVYETVGSRRARLSQESVVKAAPWVVGVELIEIEGRDLQVQLNLVTHVEKEWIERAFPSALKTVTTTKWDESQKRVTSQTQLLFHDLVLESREKGEPDLQEASRILAEKVMDGELVLDEWNEHAEQWIERVNCLAHFMPELEIPPLNVEDRILIFEQICQGALTQRDLKSRPVMKSLTQWLSSAQRQALDYYAPERIELAGRNFKVTYTSHGASISAILQHLYEVKENPKIGNGVIPLKIQILSPARRPMQVTGDLMKFWTESYPAVKSEYRGRYPKHEWR